MTKFEGPSTELVGMARVKCDQSKLIFVQMESALKLVHPLQSVLWLSLFAPALFAVADAPPTTRPATISEPAVKDGLSITVAPAKRVFSAVEPLAFTITFKNVSDKAFMLHDPGATPNYRFQFNEFWDAVYVKDELRTPAPTMQNSKVLLPDQSIEVPATLDVWWRFAWTGPQNMTKAPQPHLPAGRYRLVVTRRFEKNPADGKYPHPHWIGEITSNPVQIEIVEKAEHAQVGPGEP